MREDECSTWVEMLQTVPDPRAARGCRYPWVALLTLICAVLFSGHHSSEAVAQWIVEHAAEWQPWVQSAAQPLSSRRAGIRLARPLGD